jgi:hypothetical protein
VLEAKTSIFMPFSMAAWSEIAVAVRGHAGPVVEVATVVGGGCGSVVAAATVVAVSVAVAVAVAVALVEAKAAAAMIIVIAVLAFVGNELTVVHFAVAGGTGSGSSAGCCAEAGSGNSVGCHAETRRMAQQWFELFVVPCMFVVPPYC